MSNPSYITPLRTARSNIQVPIKSFLKDNGIITKANNGLSFLILGGINSEAG